MVLIALVGAPALVLPVVAAVGSRPSARTLGLVAASYFFIALCLTSVLWSNTLVDESSLVDTVHGWLFGAVFLMAWSTLFSAVALVRMMGRGRPISS
ncbi:hypothetical protein ACULPM_05965 [Thermophilibacter sp. ZX-H3]|uniref:hypothetical protein n=1 Tax=unclassified Thermophilibacter TaxID=2847308 RepID=UPI004040ADC4